jgi:hypothetical protein
MEHQYPMKKSFLIFAATLLLLTGLSAHLAQPATAQQRRTRTPTATVTVAPTRTVTPTPTRRPRATPTPLALILLPAPSVRNGLVGDIVSLPDVHLSSNYTTQFGDRVHFAMSNLRDLSAGEENGDGISALYFTIFDSTGEQVFRSDAAPPEALCTFTSAYGDCETWDFAANDFRWPTGMPVTSGRHLLVATAIGATSERQGTWTLDFEIRLDHDKLQGMDGAARFRSIARSGSSYSVEIDTFGFTPSANATHLHLFGNSIAEAEAVGGATGVLEFPDREERAVPGLQRMRIPVSLLRYGDSKLCVALAHPDHTTVPERGECVDLP